MRFGLFLCVRKPKLGAFKNLVFSVFVRFEEKDTERRKFQDFDSLCKKLAYGALCLPVLSAVFHI